MFAAIIVLFVVAIGIAGYILSNQRFYLPAWVPVVGTDFYDGQGRAADRPGRRSGPGPDGEHRRRQGRRGGRRSSSRTATPSWTMQIKNKYKPIYNDATILLRPKTGLKDMILALDPGTKRAGEIPEGGRVTGGQHAARREPGRGARRARRRHARLPAHPAERRRHGLPATRSRADTGQSRVRRTCARPSSASSRPRATARSSPAARQATQEHPPRDPQLPGAVHGARAARTSSSPTSWTPSNANFEAFAAQQANLQRGRCSSSPRRSRRPPPRSRDVNALAAKLGPTLEGLRPFARELAPSLRRQRPFLRDTTPIIRDPDPALRARRAADGAGPSHRHARSWRRSRRDSRAPSRC